MQLIRRIGREQLSGIVIIFSLLVVIFSVIGVNLVDVKVLNMELVDRGLYTVVTEKGNVNINPDDILRIERTYTKAPLTGVPIEIDKIYTNKGFIYLSSTDSYAETGKKLINSVDFDGMPTWERPNTNWETVKPSSYSIGTPPKQIPILFFFLTLQYAALSFGGLALTVLIFPIRFNETASQNKLTPTNPQEQDYLSDEYSAVAK